MKAYIQTRGSTRDYTFLGDEPKKWWRQPIYERGTSFEKPTLIVEKRASTWRCYVSGIPSNRRDRVNTPIRYTLVLEGENPAPADIEKLGWLVDSALQSFSAPSPSNLQKLLDAKFNFNVDEIIENRDYCNVENLLNSTLEDLQLTKSSASEKFKPFIRKIERVLKENNESAVALLNLTDNKNYIDSEIRPVFEKSTMKRLSLLETSLSGKFFDDLEQSANKAPPLATHGSRSSESAENPKKKMIWIFGVVSMVILAVLISTLALDSQ